MNRNYKQNSLDKKDMDKISKEKLIIEKNTDRMEDDSKKIKKNSHIKHDKLYIYVSLIYLIIAFVLFFGLTSNITHIAPGVGSNTYSNLWNLWWVSYSTFTLHANIWHTGLLYPPLGVNLGLEDMAPILSIISTPFQAVNLIFGYNIALIIGFVLSGVCMFLLAKYMLENSYAAFFSSIVFTYSAFHVAQSFFVLGMIFIGGIPLSVYFLLKIYNKQNSLQSSIGLGLSALLTTFMGSIQQLEMLVIVGVIIIIWFMIQKEGRKNIMNRQFLSYLLLSVIICIIVGLIWFLPLLSAYFNISSSITYTQLTSQQNSMLWSDDLLSFFLPSIYNGLLNNFASGYYSIFTPQPYQRISYLGFSAFLLAIYGLFKKHKGNMLWLVLGVLFGLFALGPYIQIATINTGIIGPYLIYTILQPLNVVYQPGMFDLVLTMCIAIFAGFGSLEIIKKINNNRIKQLTIFIITLVFLIESVGFVGGTVTSYMTTNVYTPHVYQLIANTSANDTTLVLPALNNPIANDSNLYTAQETYYSAITHKPIAGGYITGENNSQIEYLLNIPLVVESYNMQVGGEFTYDSPINQSDMNQTLLSLYNYNISFIAINGRAYNTTQIAFLLSYMGYTFGTPEISNQSESIYNTTYLYSTSNAIARNVFRDYVGYPILSDWGSSGVLVNGSIQQLWTPVNSGAIIVYAPYKQGSNVNSQIVDGYSAIVNTSISFQAKAQGEARILYLDKLEQNNSIDNIAKIYINNTNALENFEINTTMNSGPFYPNTLFFITNNTKSNYLEIKNIQFNR